MDYTGHGTMLKDLMAGFGHFFNARFCLVDDAGLAHQ